MAKRSGKSFEHILRDELARVTDFVGEGGLEDEPETIRGAAPVVSPGKMVVVSPSASKFKKDEMLVESEPFSYESSHSAKVTAAATLGIGESIPNLRLSSDHLSPPEVQRVVVEHIVKSTDPISQLHSSVKLRPFSGRVPCPNFEVDYETWRCSIEFYIADPTIASSQLVRKIVDSLLPPASSVLRSLGPHSTPKAYLDLLDSAYATVEDRDELFAKFLNINQNTGEKPSDYLRRLQTALNKPVSDILEVEGANGQCVPYTGYVQITIKFPKEFIPSEPEIQTLALIVSDVRSNSSIPILIGTNTLDPLYEQVCDNISWRPNFYCGYLQVLKTLQLRHRQSSGRLGLVKLNSCNPDVIPAGQRVVLEGSVNVGAMNNEKWALLEQPSVSSLPGGVFIDCCLITIPTCLPYKVPVVLRNETSHDVVLPRNCVIAELSVPYKITPTQKTTTNQLQETSPSCQPETASCSSPQSEASSQCQQFDKGSELKFDFGDSPLSEEWKNRITQRLNAYSDVFSHHDLDFGHATKTKHSIKLKDETPFKHRPRPIHPQDYDAVRRHLQTLLDAGIIRESESPFSSPIVIVRKKNGDVRLCVDYRRLNMQTIKDAYALPNLEESFSAMNGSQWFSVMDLKSGYYQIEMEESDKPKTAFVCPLGFWEWNRMPQGITNAPSTFQRLMEKCMGDMHLREVLVFIDDLIVFSKTLEEHEVRLTNVLDRLRDNGLKLSPEKCRFAQTSVRYLGHIVSRNGVETDPQKIEALKTWPRPQTLKELKSFLGFSGYYRRFVQDYSKIVKPLTKLTAGYPPNRKGARVNKTDMYYNPKDPFGERWTPVCQESFEKIIEKLTSSPVLGFANPKLPYILHTDASTTGLGAALYQEHDGQSRVIAYASRGLSHSEARYPAHKLEFLALKWAVTEKFHDYLYGNTFTVVTDNNPLRYILTTAKLDATGYRWLAALSTFTFDIKYRAGKQNQDADGLSRRPHGQLTSDSQSQEESLRIREFTSYHLAPAEVVKVTCQYHTVAQDELSPAPCLIESLAVHPDAVPAVFEKEGSSNGLSTIPKYSSTELAKLQRADPEISAVIKLIEAGESKSTSSKQEPIGLRLMLKEMSRFELKNGLLYRKRQCNDQLMYQLVLPQVLRQSVLTSLHDEMGHMGMERTLELARLRFYWPKLASDVELKVKGCARCVKRKSQPEKAAPLVSIHTSRPMELVCMDFLSLEPDSHNTKDILVITDHFTKYAVAIPTKDQKATTVARCLWEQFLVHYGFPERLHSDQGRDFESQIIKELCSLVGIRKIRTSPYHPRGNPVERYNRTLLSMLGTLKEQEKTKWREYVKPLTHAYNCTKNEVTGFTPYELMFGRQPRLPIDIAFGLPVNESSVIPHSQYVKRLKSYLTESYQLAAANAKKVADKNKRRFDMRVRESTLEIGDRVLVRNLRLRGKHKLADRWESTPVSDILEVEGANGQCVPYTGYVQITIKFPKEFIPSEPEIQTLALIVSDVRSNSSIPILIGTNTLDPLYEQVCDNISWRPNFYCGYLQVLKTLQLRHRQSSGRLGLVKLNSCNPDVIPAGQRVVLEGSVNVGAMNNEKWALLEQPSVSSLPGGVFIDCCLITIPTCLPYKVPVVLRNETSHDVVLPRNCVIAELSVPYKITPTQKTTTNQLQETSPSCQPETASCSSPQSEASSQCQQFDKGSELKFDFGDSPLSEEWKNRITQRLNAYSDVFSHHDLDFGHATKTKHSIKLKDETPFKHRPRPIHPQDYDAVRRHLQTLLDAGIIRESESPFSSPIVIVRKKNGDVRLCVDYRRLNMQTIKDAYALPNLEESFSAMNGSQWFSVMDLKSGYYQIEMEESDKPKTAFVCPLGFWEWNRMPQGITNAPSTFQRLMEKCMGDMHLREVLVFIDDLIVFSKTLEEHEVRLTNVLDRLRDNGLKLSPEKCRFAQTSVRYLGHIVSRNGVETDPQKIEALKTWPRPQTLKELKSFLGFSGYYRRFVQDYSKIVKPLTKLTAGYPPNRKGARVNKTDMYYNPKDPFGERWTPVCQESFEKIIEKLTSSPVLGFANPKLPYILHTDASTTGLGAALYQEHDGQSRVIAYASRGLSHSEARYPAHKLEFLALKWAVTEKFHDYLYGNTFTVVTDNNPLRYILTTAKLDATGYRWLAALSTFTFDIKYRAGKQNQDADGLSRRPHGQLTSDSQSQEESLRIREFTSYHLAPAEVVKVTCQYHTVAQDELSPAPCLIESLAVHPDAVPAVFEKEGSSNGLSTIPKYSSTELAKLQRADPEISAVIKLIEAGESKSTSSKQEPIGLRLMLKEMSRFELKNGLLYRKRQCNDQLMYQLVLPQVLRQSVLTSLHDEMGHMGMERTLELARLRFYWPKLASDVELKVKGCARCVKRKSQPEKAAPLVSIHTSRPMELVCMDFLSLEPDSHNTKDILVITDHFTKYAVAIPTKDQKATTVARCLWEQFLVHYGFPERLHSDQGRDFESQIIKELCSLVGIRKIRTSPYHPRGNPVERYNRTLLSMLGTLKEQEKTKWREYVKPLTHAYNCTKNEVTGFTPYELMFGRQPRLPIDIAFGLPVNESSVIPHSQYVKRLKSYLTESYQLAAANAKKVADKNKRRFDMRVRESTLEIGDRVLVRNLRLRGKHKLADRWESTVRFFISGPIPTLGRGVGWFSRLLSLHTWLQPQVSAHGLFYVDNFNLLWDRPQYFKQDGLHPNFLGSRMLTENTVHSISVSGD
ncbi:hypothetical protein Q8A73_005098 [Channa argus]|nr:hypothetical protein Q8A73_005097 [Channa argus]KAK2879335.1 hypothetical protein Q8A73_005098 [Channa argus]